MCISICVWIYEDRKMLHVLKQYSQQHYEIAELLQIRDVYSSVHLSKYEQRQAKKLNKKKKKKKNKKRKEGKQVSSTKRDQVKPSGEKKE